MTHTTHTTPTTTPRPFTHEAHAYDWVKLHHRPIITAVIAGFLVVAAVRWWVDRRKQRRHAAIAWWREPVCQLLHCQPEVMTARFERRRLVYLRLTHPADAREWTSNAISGLKAALTARLGMPVDVTLLSGHGHLWWRKQASIELALAHPVKPVEDTDGRVARAQSLARQLLGSEATVDKVVRRIDGSFKSFQIDHANIHDAKPEFRKDVDTTMQAKLGQRLQPQWEEHRDRVIYRAAATLPTHVPHPVPTVGDVIALPFGVDANNNTLAWNLNGRTPHALFAGPTGGGKSNALRTVILEATFHGIEVKICDGKKVSLLGLEDWPGVTRLALSSKDIAGTILDVHAELLRRQDLLTSRRAKSRNLAPMILVIDELWVVLENLAADHKAAGLKGDPPAVLAFRSLAREGRELRLHLLVGIQRPDAEITKGETRSNFGCRLIVGDSDVEIRRMLKLEKVTISSAVVGRGVTNASGREAECQVYWSPDPGDYDEMSAADRAIIDGLRPPGATFHMAPSAAPEPEPIAPLLPFVPRIVEAEPEPPTPRKACTKCGRNDVEFGKDRSKPDGLNVRCKGCDRDLVAARRAAKTASLTSAEKGP